MNWAGPQESLPWIETEFPGPKSQAPSNQEKLHAGEKQNEKYDRDLRKTKKSRVRLVVFGIVHGGMAARSIHTHVFSPCLRACSAVLVTQCPAIIKPGSKHLWNNDNVSQGAQMSLSGHRVASLPRLRPGLQAAHVVQSPPGTAVGHFRYAQHGRRAPGRRRPQRLPQ